jgi:chromate reductase, NAD(P)H dehydrogenase (quinone)
MSRPHTENALRNVPVAVVGASTGAFGAVWAQAELRKVLGAMGARVVEGQLALGHAHQQLGADGHLADDDHRAQLTEVVSQLAAAAAARVPVALAA